MNCEVADPSITGIQVERALGHDWVFTGTNKTNIRAVCRRCGLEVASREERVRAMLEAAMA